MNETNFKLLEINNIYTLDYNKTLNINIDSDLIKYLISNKNIDDTKYIYDNLNTNNRIKFIYNCLLSPFFTDEHKKNPDIYKYVTNNYINDYDYSYDEHKNMLYGVLQMGCYLGEFEIIKNMINKNPEILNYNIENNKDYNSHKILEIHETLCRYNFIDILKYIVDKYNLTINKECLYYACMSGSINMFNYILEKTNKKIVKNVEENMLFLNEASLSESNEKLELIKYLIKILYDKDTDISKLNLILNILNNLKYIMTSNNKNNDYYIFKYLFDRLKEEDIDIDNIKDIKQIIKTKFFFTDLIHKFCITYNKDNIDCNKSIIFDNELKIFEDNSKKIIDLLINEIGIKYFNDNNDIREDILNIASISKNYVIVEYLLECGVVINHTYFYKYLYYYISPLENIDNLIKIFDKYYNINYIYENNETILFAIFKSEYFYINDGKNINEYKNNIIKFIKYAINKGVNLNHINDDNKRIIDYLYENIENIENSKNYEEFLSSINILENDN